MPPKGKKQDKAKAAKPAPKVYDYSGMETGMKLHIEFDGVYYAGEVVQVSKAKNRTKAPVKVTYKGYEGGDEWVGGDRLRSKALKIVKPEKEEAVAKKPLLEVNFGYWKIRGLGAVFRMILEYKGVKYTDNQYEGEAGADKWFKEDKPKILEKNPLANLPYLEAGSDCICQTNACLSYIGNRLRLNGFSRKASLLNEQLLCEIYDVRNAMIDVVYPFKKVCRDEEEHKEKAKKTIEAGPFKKFEAILEKEGTDYFCGKAPCTSDFHIWEMLDQHKLLAEKHGCGDIFESIPKCKAFYDKFKALPTLQKYFESEAYKFPVNNPFANTYFA
jgi:glutathione S-transferase